MNSLQGRLSAVLSASFLRFFAASLFGLVLDVALAAILHRFAGLPLMLSAALSLIAAAVLMYLVHEFWTFRSGAGRLSLGRMAGTVGSSLVALAVRTSVLYATTHLIGLGDRWALLQLLTATGASFVVNYVLVRRIVGRRKPVAYA